MARGKRRVRRRRSSNCSKHAESRRKRQIWLVFCGVEDGDGRTVAREERRIFSMIAKGVFRRGVLVLAGAAMLVLVSPFASAQEEKRVRYPADSDRATTLSEDHFHVTASPKRTIVRSM